MDENRRSLAQLYSENSQENFFLLIQFRLCLFVVFFSSVLQTSHLHRVTECSLCVFRNLYEHNSQSVTFLCALKFCFFLANLSFGEKGKQTQVPCVLSLHHSECN